MQYLDRVEQPQAPMPVVMPFTREGREMARNERQAVAQGHRDYQQAKLQAHRIQLSTELEKLEASQRAELIRFVMSKAVEVDSTARALAQGREGLAFTLGQLMQAYNEAELLRAIRRGAE